MTNHKKLPGNYITMNEMIYANEKIRDLPCSAQLAWIYLIAWSKHNRKNGAFGKAGQLACSASKEDLEALLQAELIKGTGNKELPWEIVGWSRWQTTNEEIEQMRAAKSRAGKAGGKKSAASRAAHKEQNTPNQTEN